MNESPQAQASLLAIEGEFTIYTAAEQGARLQGHLAECASLDLDLSAVSEIDSAGIQLLLWAARRAGAQGGRLRLLGHGDAVTAAVRLLQLDALLASADQTQDAEDPT